MIVSLFVIELLFFDVDNDFDNDLNRQQPTLNIAMNFIVRQDDNYISEFIRSYQDACLNAFNKLRRACCDVTCLVSDMAVSLYLIKQNSTSTQLFY